MLAPYLLAIGTILIALIGVPTLWLLVVGKMLPAPAPAAR
jgi:hypothetical protein